MKGRIMQLSVKKRGQAPNELRFKTGPIYIGRQVGSQVFLPDRSVSRQHSVIYQDSSNKWMIEDLASTNKTIVNNTAVHKCAINDNDVIKTGDFIIRVMLNEAVKADASRVEKQIHLDDTIADGIDITGQIVRQPMARNAPPLTLPAKRIKDFQRALKIIFNADSVKALHAAIISLLQGQLGAHNAWAALTTEPNGQMMIEEGRTIGSERIAKKELVKHTKISYALEKQTYILLPQLQRTFETGRIRSLMIAPVIQDGKNFGMIYVNNTAEHERYELADLDYLLLITSLIANQLTRL
jgi:pSer/pThr/pTyr-binding forkhead associated (FHA) protein